MTQPKTSRLLQILQEQSLATRVLKAPSRDLGLKEGEPFPFLAIIGQKEMKLALLLAAINPRVGGVLLIGARGTAKTTAVRSLLDLLPTTRQSLCPNNMGCTEAQIEQGGMTAVCKECAAKFAYGDPLTQSKRMKLVELPLNARLEDVVGGISERSVVEKKQIRLERGLLAQADNNLLYIDEVNLLDDAVMDAILDAAAQGYYTVRRGPHNLTYSARLGLVGSMNPEEGRLRPQIMDRFGLRAVVRGLENVAERYEAYELALWHRQNSEGMAAAYAEMTLALADEVQQAYDRLPLVTISPEAKRLGLALVQAAKVESNRAEITLFEAARAHAAAEERLQVLPEDITAVSLLALRQRNSPQLLQFFAEQQAEDEQLQAQLAELQQSLSRANETEEAQT
jgi:magnesium chelatase subunit I